MTEDQVLFLFELWLQDIDSAPFAHEDFWSTLDEEARR